MPKRYMSIWFRSIKTDWYIRHQPLLKDIPFVLVVKDHGRMVVSASNTLAWQQGVNTGAVLADARAIIPGLKYFDDEAEKPARLLHAFAQWCIRYTPAAAVDLPDGLLLDITGCAHLWGGEENYLADISKRLHDFGYNTRASIADTIGTAWAIARYGRSEKIIEPNGQCSALLELPPPSLRLEQDILEQLFKLGLKQIDDFIHMPRRSLRRRFGGHLLLRLDQALGNKEELLEPEEPIAEYQERLPCLEPIITAAGIEIALQLLLARLCNRLQKEEKGLRKAILKCFRVDTKMEQITIGTLHASCNTKHLFKLFEEKISGIEPALGIELFLLEAPVVEEMSPTQEQLFEINTRADEMALAELLDRISARTNSLKIHHYLPDEHHWPERSFKDSSSLLTHQPVNWKTTRPRPVHLLSRPSPIEVTAPIPDYPPMLFRYRGKLHKVARADGPERIEQEWWLQEGQHRDYYYVEDEEGCRYWLFRSGHYDNNGSSQWFIHGFFA